LSASILRAKYIPVIRKRVQGAGPREGKNIIDKERR